MNKFDPFAESVSADELINNFRHDLLNFFQDQVIDNVHKWDIIVKIDRKGILVFDDLIKDAQLSIEILQIPSFDIPHKKKIFQNKRVLVFDDSIRTGGQISTAIDEINTLGVISISVAVVLAKEDTYEKLKEEYKNINFIQYKILNDVDFLYFFGKYMPSYFDYICMPQTKDLRVIKFTIPCKLSKSDVVNLFNTGKRKVEIIKTGIEYDDRFKMILEFTDDEIKEIEVKVIPKTIDLKLDTCKIRFFIHMLNIETNIYIEYIINPVGDFMGCCGDFKDCINSPQKETDPMCLLCSIYNLTNYARNMLEKDLIAQNKPYDCYALPWKLFYYL